MAAIGIALIAWFGALATPCAMAWTSNAKGGEPIAEASAHAPCHNAKPDKPMSDADCCCDLTLVGSPNAPEFPHCLNWIAVAFDAHAMDLQRADAPPRAELRLLRHERSPPVYFVTQRLRI